MRTSIVIDERLMKRAMRASGTTTQREAVEKGLKLLLRLGQQKKIRNFRGKLRWDDDLEAMRRDP